MKIEIYTDGAFSGHGQGGKRCGLGAVLITERGKYVELSKGFLMRNADSNTTELLALHMAITHVKKELRPGIYARIVSDSLFALEHLNNRPPRHARSIGLELRAILSQYKLWDAFHVNKVPDYAKAHHYRAHKLAQRGSRDAGRPVCPGEK